MGSFDNGTFENPASLRSVFSEELQATHAFSMGAPEPKGQVRTKLNHMISFHINVPGKSAGSAGTSYIIPPNMSLQAWCSVNLCVNALKQHHCCLQACGMRPKCPHDSGIRF